MLTQQHCKLLERAQWRLVDAKEVFQFALGKTIIGDDSDMSLESSDDNHSGRYDVVVLQHPATAKISAVAVGSWHVHYSEDTGDAHGTSFLVAELS